MPAPLPATTTRVTESTADAVNAELRARMHERLQHYAAQPGQIEQRLRELEREWDIERTLEANAAGIGLGGLLLGATVDRRFFLLTGGVLGFLLQHAIQGWCPPVPVFRRLGVRTASEIETERHALKILRGDYADLPRQPGVDAALDRLERPALH